MCVLIGHRADDRPTGSACAKWYQLLFMPNFSSLAEAEINANHAWVTSMTFMF